MKTDVRSRVTCEVSVVLTEEEARALEALAGYGLKSFLEVFYKHMGKSYLQPYERGLASLFDTIGHKIKPEFKHVDSAREYLSRQDHYERARSLMAAEQRDNQAKEQVLVLCRTIIQERGMPRDGQGIMTEIMDKTEVALARKLGKILEPNGVWFTDVMVKS